MPQPLLSRLLAALVRWLHSFIGLLSGPLKGSTNFLSTKISYLIHALVAVGTILGLRELSSKHSIDQFYPAEHPFITQDQEIRRIFRLEESAPHLFIVSLPRGHWLQPKNIKKLQQLSGQIEENRGVVRLLSLARIEEAHSDDQELQVGSIFDRLPARQWKNAVLSNPLMHPVLITRDLRSTLLVVETKAKSSGKAKLEDQIRDQIQSAFPQAQILTAGIPALQNQVADKILGELVQLILWCLGVFVLVLYFLFGHWKSVLVSMICLIQGTLLSLACLGLFKIPLNILLMTLPIVAAVTVMSLLIHSLHRWAQWHQEGLYRSLPPQRRAVKLMEELFTANNLGALTTALGFLALAGSHIPLIKIYAWSVAAIVFVVSLQTQFLILTLLPQIEIRPSKWFQIDSKWALFSLKRAPLILAGGLILITAAVMSVPKLNFSARLFDDLPQNDLVRASTEWMDQAMGGVVPYELTLKSQKKNFWKSPQNLQKLRTLEQHIRRHPHVGSVVGLTDFFQGPLPDQRSQVSETLFLFSLAEHNPLLNFLSENSKQMRLMIRMKDRDGAELLETRQWILASVKALFPELIATEGGVATYAHHINQEVSKKLIFGFWESMALIALMLLVVFRSLRWVIVACLPNLLAPLSLILVLALAETSLKPSIALVFSIALGFAFNNTIYLLNRLRQLLQQSHPDPLKQALKIEANPCLWESLVMLLGFSTFLASSFAMNQSFGFLMLVSIVAGFFGDLFVLPALLQKFPKILNLPSSGLSHFESSPNSSVASLSSASLAGFLIISAFPNQVRAQSAKEILQKARQKVESRDNRALVEMKIIEKNGEIKTRTLRVQTLQDKSFSILARMTEPADVRGMAFLGKIEAGIESQWIYLPSSGKTRRLVGRQSQAGLLGSELSSEDLNSTAIQSSSIKKLKSASDLEILQIIPQAGTSRYSEVRIFIDPKVFVPRKTEYFIRQRKIKTVLFQEYKSFGAIQRPLKVHVFNHQNHRQTQVRFQELQVNSGLKSSEFTPNSLRRD